MMVRKLGLLLYPAMPLKISLLKTGVKLLITIGNDGNMAKST